MGLFPKDKSAKVLIAEPVSAVRQAIVDVVREFGFQDSLAVSSCKELVEVLEVETPAWIILALTAQEPVNGLQVLRLVTEQDHLRGVRISLFVDEHEDPCLPRAFSLGLLSSHRRIFSRDGVSSELSDLMARSKRLDGNDCLIAASYLRAYLRRKNRFSSLLDMEEKLGKLFPTNTNLILSLADAQALKGEKDEAYRNLRIAEMVDSSLQPQAAVLMKQHFGQLPADELARLASLNILGVEHCLLVDSDGLVQNAMQQYLRGAGVTRIDTFSDGEAAAQWCKSATQPDLIIHEWKIPKLTGPLFLQRVRAAGFQQVPIVVVSSLLKASDLPLLKEMSVDAVISKPFDQANFLRNILWLVRQHQRPTEQKAILQKIRRYLADGQMAKAQTLRDDSVADGKLTAGQKLLVDAEFSFYNGDYSKTRDYGMEALKHSGESLVLLNLIGKSLLRLGDFANALKFLEKAQASSPMNIERLCQIATVQWELGAHDDAAASLDKAAALDAQHEGVVTTSCNFALVRGDTKKAGALLGQLDSAVPVVSYMNSRAVALSRCGRFDEGIDLYLRTLEALPETWSDAHAAINYNLALALARQGQLEKALTYLSAIPPAKTTAVYKKAASLAKRVAHSIKAKQPLVLPVFESNPLGAKDGTSVAANDASLAATAVPSVGPELLTSDEDVAAGEGAGGDFCCLHLYEATPDDIDPNFEKLLDRRPRYQVRKAIERGKGEHVKKA